MERGGTGTIIVLNGASSAGKTSLAQALRASADRPWFWVTTDHFWPMLPSRFGPADEIPLRAAASRAFLQTVLLLSGAGWDVVADAVVAHPIFTVRNPPSRPRASIPNQTHSSCAGADLESHRCARDTR